MLKRLNEILDLIILGEKWGMRKFEEVLSPFKVHKGKPTKLPARADKGSAGYDFYSKETVTIPPKQYHKFWTDVKAKMPSDEVLLIFPRSSLGLKGLMMANTVGVIDSSYYGNFANDGNIGIVLYNYGETPVTIEEGERIAQGIFTKFYIVDNDIKLKEKREGGFGSSGRGTV